MNNFQKYKIMSGKSLSQIANEIDLTVTSVSKIINYPWRTKIESALKIGNAIGMQEHIIKKEWAAQKEKKYKQKINESI